MLFLVLTACIPFEELMIGGVPAIAIKKHSDSNEMMILSRNILNTCFKVLVIQTTSYNLAFILDVNCPVNPTLLSVRSKELHRFSQVAEIQKGYQQS